MRKVMVFGTFDGIHPGHLDFFKQAKQYGDYLMVVLARDDTVRQVKGKWPKKSQEQRLTSVRAVDFVNTAVLGNTGDKHDVVREHKPDVICLGYDQQVFTRGLRDKFPRVKIVRLKSCAPAKYKSSKMYA